MTSTDAATVLVGALVDAGVREVVLCPGSRSSALAYAVWQAERAGHLRLHVRVDERSGGFLALGLAKVSRRPAVVITTSGTAVANLHPAVLEAHHALVPLIVLSADRPADLRGTGANQTTVQPGIFAGACRDEADIAPDASPTDLVGRALDAVAAATGSRPGASGAGAPARPGPVHLNVQFREPLVPEVLPLDDQDPALLDPKGPGTGPEAGHGKAAGDAPVDGQRTSGIGTFEPLPERTLLVVGDLPTLADHRRVVDWAVTRSLPVVAEPFGVHPRMGVVRHGVLVVGTSGFLDEHEPEAVVVAGRPTLSRPITQLLRRAGVRVLVLDAGQEFDVPGKVVDRVLLRDLDLLTVDRREFYGAPTTPPVVGPDNGWLSSWLDAGERVGAAVADQPPPAGTGAAFARVVATALPEGALLFLGSSSTPRDLDLAATLDSRVDVVASRGLAGIDGCVSTAIGLALAEPDRPTYAVLGDLTFLHDSGGLLIGAHEPRPDLTIVVLNDDGGGIFATLEPGAPPLVAAFERLFGTPTGTDLAALCRAHGIPHVLTASASELAAAVAIPPNGLRVVETRVDRGTHRAERTRLAALAADTLAGP